MIPAPISKGVEGKQQKIHAVFRAMNAIPPTTGRLRISIINKSSSLRRRNEINVMQATKDMKATKRAMFLFLRNDWRKDRGISTIDPLSSPSEFFCSEKSTLFLSVVALGSIFSAASGVFIGLSCIRILEWQHLNFNFQFRLRGFGSRPRAHWLVWLTTALDPTR
jgi:hypothetical protein